MEQVSRSHVVASRYSSRLAAILLAVVCFALARLPTPASSELAVLASRFGFERIPLLELPGHPPYKHVRQVHPSLERISAWVSSLGAAATLADLDGDGLANDIVQVDPRTDLVIVAPAPGAPRRFEPFALDSSFWSGDSYDLSTIAPMGSVAGDYNEDGALDLLVYFWGRTPVLYLRRSVGAADGLSPAAFVPRELLDSGDRWYSNSALQADLDGDDHVDLLIGGYYMEGARVLDPSDTGTVVLHEGKARALNGGHEHFFLWREATSGADQTIGYPVFFFQYSLGEKIERNLSGSEAAWMVNELMLIMASIEPFSSILNNAGGASCTICVSFMRSRPAASMIAALTALKAPAPLDQTPKRFPRRSSTVFRGESLRTKTS